MTKTPNDHISLGSFVNLILLSVVFLECSPFLSLVLTMFKEFSVLFLVGVVFADQRLSYETHVACTLPDGRVIEHGEKFEDGCKDCRFDHVPNSVYCKQQLVALKF